MRPFDKDGGAWDLKGRTPAFFCSADVTVVDAATVRQLRDWTAEHGGCEARICLHGSPDSPVHEMVVLLRPEKYHRPHRHPRKGECYHAMEGSLAVLLFNEDGTVRETSVIEAGSNAVVRVPQGVWHATLPLTDPAVFHESRPGPFRPADDSEFPTWAPDGGDRDEAQAFVERLLREL